ncbi:MAG: DNA-deoxyinosine glycosylase [Ruminococcaceae bacterium]|nr:DNA-deoxyinosine glycosylase [Oscillospiraceae bacterium]
MVTHPFPPLFDKTSHTLILGSFPSVKSREQQFFYGHPQNRFWRVLAAVFSCPVPETVAEKKDLVLSRHLALWDVLAACEITGSADSAIRNPVPNDLTPILSAAPISRIFMNGRAAEKYFQQYMGPLLGRQAICLPSTSPANAAYSLEKLVAAWEIIGKSIDNTGEL